MMKCPRCGSKDISLKVQTPVSPKPIDLCNDCGVDIHDKHVGVIADLMAEFPISPGPDYHIEGDHAL